MEKDFTPSLNPRLDLESKPESGEMANHIDSVIERRYRQFQTKSKSTADMLIELRIQCARLISVSCLFSAW